MYKFNIRKQFNQKCNKKNLHSVLNNISAVKNISQLIDTKVNFNGMSFFQLLTHKSTAMIFSSTIRHKAQSIIIELVKSRMLSVRNALSIIPFKIQAEELKTLLSLDKKSQADFLAKKFSLP